MTAASSVPGGEDRVLIYDRIGKNKRQTWLMMAVFVVLIGTLATIMSYWFGGTWQILPFVYGVLIIWAGVSYYASASVALGVSGARQVTKEDEPELYRIVENLSIGSGLPMPKVYVIEDTAPNAFATGRDPAHAAIVVTSGLLDKLNRLELEGVLAHEMAHIQHYDIRVATVAAVLVGMVALMSDWFLRSMYWGRRRGSRHGGAAFGFLILVGFALAALAPVAAQLLRLAISRSREFLADAAGALLTRYPEGLASALEKISADPEPLEAANKATAHMYIINPLREWGGWTNALFNTHPPVEERVRRLRDMSG